MANNFTNTENEIIEIILGLMFSDANLNIDHQIGMRIESLKDKHKVCLTVNNASQFYETLKRNLDRSIELKLYNDIESLGYSDCISWTPTPPAVDSIFMPAYCSDIRWYNGFTILVTVDGIYIDFEEIKRVLLKVKQAENYKDIKIDTLKLFQMIKGHINEGKYAVYEDEYI